MKHARFFKVYRHHRDEGCVVTWHRTITDAREALHADLMEPETYDSGPSGIDTHAIPLNTEAFIRFLNLHASRDNG